MNKFFVTLIALTAITLANPSFAGQPDCDFSTSDPEVDINGFYADIDDDRSIWLYGESNGIAGLQRADAGHDDTCEGKIAGDTPFDL